MSIEIVSSGVGLIDIRELKVGDAVHGQWGDTNPVGVYLRTYDGLVLLDDPGETWTYKQTHTFGDPYFQHGSILVNLRIEVTPR